MKANKIVWPNEHRTKQQEKKVITCLFTCVYLLREENL